MSSTKQCITPPITSHVHDMDSPDIWPKEYRSSNHVEHPNQMKPINIATPRQFTLFENQVAGTLPMLHADGMLYKPLKTEMEQTFYKNIVKWLPAIKPFIPRYDGMEHIKINIEDSKHSKATQQSGASSASPSVASSTVTAVNSDHDSSLCESDVNQLRLPSYSHSHSHSQSLYHTPSFNTPRDIPAANPWSARMFNKNKHRIAKTPFLILEDITGSFHKPCILDLKIGTRHFAPICKDRKMHRKLRKAWCSTCKHFGVRVGGVQRYDIEHSKYHIMAKDVAMKLDRNAFVSEICDFFDRLPHRKMLCRFISKLQRLYNVLREEHRFRWFSCSLLFVYEGQTRSSITTTDEQMSGGTGDGTRDGTNGVEVGNGINEPQTSTSTVGLHALNPQNAQNLAINEMDDDSSMEHELPVMDDPLSNLSESVDSEADHLELLQHVVHVDGSDDVSLDADGMSPSMRMDLRLIDFTNFVIVKDHLEALTKQVNEGDDIEDVDENEDDEEDTDEIVENMNSVVVDSDDSNGSKDGNDVVDAAEDEEEDKHQSASPMMKAIESEQGIGSCSKSLDRHPDGNQERLQLLKELDSLEEPDHGILFGLESLIKLLSELQSTGTIKRRTDEEWDQFKASLEFMEMALVPFRDRKMFNENTTIH